MWYPGERDFDEAGLAETGDSTSYEGDPWDGWDDGDPGWYEDEDEDGEMVYGVPQTGGR